MKKAFILALMLVLAISGIANAAKPTANTVTISDQSVGVPFVVNWTASSKYQYLWTRVDCDNGFEEWKQVRYERWEGLQYYTVDSPANCVAYLMYPRWHGEWNTWVSLADKTFNVR